MEAGPESGSQNGHPQSGVVLKEIKRRRESLPIFSMKEDLIDVSDKFNLVSLLNICFVIVQMNFVGPEKASSTDCCRRHRVRKINATATIFI